jgi:N-acetyl-anhydromuramyl-L-alanine amidase AmpD
VKGSVFLATLPEKACAEREQAIIHAVQDGYAMDAAFMPVDVEYNGHKGTIFIGTDVLRIGESGDFVRVNVNAATAQLIADMKGWILPTTKIVDILWKAAYLKVEPCLQPADPTDRFKQGMPKCSDGTTSMSDTPAMLKHSNDIEMKVTGDESLFENGGKHWVLSNKLTAQPDHAANYGWFSNSAPYTSASGLKMWQTLGLAHNLAHVDYSQSLRAVHADMVVNGQTRKVAEVAADPDLWGLVSSEGPLKLSRYPGVPPADDLYRDPIPPAVKPCPTKRLSIKRVLKKGMYGDDVAEWQAFIGCAPDGKFGKITDSITRSWQRDHGLLVDGEVAPKTVAAANSVQFSREMAGTSPKDDLISDFIQAKNYTKGKGAPREINYIVIHSAESPEKPTMAEALAAWAAGKNAPDASWHFAVDNDSVVQSVYEEDIAWHAPGVNDHSIGIEHAGYAKQTTTEWFDEFSRDMLLLSARLCAHLCATYRIPIKFVDAAGLLRGDRGITTHAEVTKAFHKSPHTDPGAGFPMDWFLEQIA